VLLQLKRKIEVFMEKAKEKERLKEEELKMNSDNSKSM